MKIDMTDGQISINDALAITPHQAAQAFLESDLYQNYSLDKATLESLAFQKRIVLKIPDLGLKWYFAIDFEDLVLSSVRFYLVRNAIDEISKASNEDLKLFAKLLKSWFGWSPTLKESRSGVSYSFPWGFVKSGTYPDGILAKVIIGYKRF